MTDLLDASVWVPLAAPDHPHYSRARQYWEQESASQVAFCRVTALAMLRHLTNRHIMQSAVLTSGEAWDVYQQWRRLPEVIMLSDPVGLDGHLQSFCLSMALSPQLWTDAYLAAFAVAGNLRLVAFDRDFVRFDGVDLLLLE